MNKTLRMILGILFLFAGLMIVGCKNDNGGSTGSQPSISGVNPAQVSIAQRNVEGSILGANLNGVTSVSLGDAITVHSFNSISASEVRVVFSVNDNAAAGPRTIVVQTSNGSATSSSHFSVSSNRAPRANFTIDPPAGSVAITFSFDASRSSDDKNVTGYSWSFGDGATANGKKVTHKYASVGTYKVQLTVSDAEGATDRNEREVEIKKNSPPIARFSVRPDEGDTITTFTFDASRSEDPDGKIKEYRWDFGDGDKRKGEKVTHVYEKAGNYTVRLSVEDNKGEIGRIEKELEVKKSEGHVCNPRPPNESIAYRATVENWEPSTKTVTLRFVGNPGCKAFYRCGDIRKGGLKGWGDPYPEKWIGVMCKFIDLGNGKAQIRVVLGNYQPVPGDKVYTWPQKDCTTRVCGNIQ